jgi:hypothetical protein
MEETLESRVLTLEQTVEQQATVRDLEALQSAIGSQILQLGSQMHGEFSALRREVQAGDAETRDVLRAEIRAGDAETRQLLDERTKELREGIRSGNEQTRGLVEERTALLAVVAADSRETREVLRTEIQAGNAQTRLHARTLHEDLIERIKAISRG